MIEHLVHDPIPGLRIVGGDEAGGDLGERRGERGRRRGARVRIRLQRRQRGAVRAQARERRPFGRERLARAQALFERERGDRLRRGVALRARPPSAEPASSSSGRPTRPRSCRSGRRAWLRPCRSGRRGRPRSCLSGRRARLRACRSGRSAPPRRPRFRRSAGREPGRRAVSRFPGPPRSPEPKPWPLRRAPLALPPAQQRPPPARRRGFQLRQAFVDRVQRGRLGEARLPGLEAVDARPERLGFQRRRGRARFQHPQTLGEVLRRIASRLVIPRRAERGRRADDRAAESPDERTAGRSLARGGRRPGWADRGGFDRGFGRRLRRRFRRRVIRRRFRRRHVCRRLRRVG